MAKTDLYNNKEETRTPKGEAKDVGLWLERISIGKKAQEQFSQDSGADRFIKEYKGEYGIVFNTRNKKVPVPPINEVFAYVQADIASTYNRDPYITVNAEAGTVKGAAIWEVILNYWWRKLKIKEELEYEIIDKDLVGYAWHKVGNEVDVKINADGTPSLDSKLYSKWVHWKDIIWNVGSKRPPLDCLWMAQRIIKPLQEVRDKYPAAKWLEGSPDPQIDQDAYRKATYKDDIKVAILWEVWDKQKKQVYLLAENLKDKYLESPKPWPDHQKDFPFRMYWDFAIPDRPQPMSAIAPWETQILEEMVLMGQSINHAKRWNRQMFVKNGQIDDNALDKFERGDDGAVITVNGNMDETSFKLADFGQLPTDFYLLMDRLQAIKRNINGQPEFTRGGVTKTNTRTIGELQLIQQGNQSRQGRKIDRLETHCENIARDMMANLKANFDFDETVKITGDTPEEIMEALGDNFNRNTGEVKFTLDDILGEYDVDIKAGSTLPLDKQTRAQIFELILQTVAQIAGQGPMSNFMATLIGEILKDYDIKSLREAYEADLVEYQKAKRESDQTQSIDEDKMEMEAAKREAQARQVEAKTQIIMQEASLGPVGRAEIEQIKKTPIITQIKGEKE